MGFGTVSPGVWVAPGLLHDEVARTPGAPGAARRSSTCSALAYDGFGSLRDRVGEWWDLPAIEKEYAEFLDEVRRRACALDGVRRPPRGTAFETYVAMLTEWRRLPYLDPGLPLELLPPGWNGSKAAERCSPSWTPLLRDPGPRATPVHHDPTR